MKIRRPKMPTPWIMSPPWGTYEGSDEYASVERAWDQRASLERRAGQVAVGAVLANLLFVVVLTAMANLNLLVPVIYAVCLLLAYAYWRHLSHSAADWEERRANVLETLLDKASRMRRTGKCPECDAKLDIETTGLIRLFHCPECGKSWNEIGFDITGT
jgi:hypothetical protein